MNAVADEGSGPIVLLNTQEVAKMLGKSSSWVSHKASEGVLPSVKVGGARRFVQRELEAWILKQRG